MLYHLIEYLEAQFQPPGFQAVQYITVRAALAAITALALSLVVGRRMIKWLHRKQIGEQVREGTAAGFIDHAHKKGTPTMGGVIILFSMLLSTLLWGDLTEVYVWVAVLATAWMVSKQEPSEISTNEQDFEWRTVRTHPLTVTSPEGGRWSTSFTR